MGFSVTGYNQEKEKEKKKKNFRIREGQRRGRAGREVVVAYARRSYGQHSIPHDRSTSRGGTLRAGRSRHVARRDLVKQYALSKFALAGRDVTSGVKHVGVFRLYMAKLSLSYSCELFFSI